MDHDNDDFDWASCPLIDAAGTCLVMGLFFLALICFLGWVTSQ